MDERKVFYIEIGKEGIDNHSSSLPSPLPKIWEWNEIANVAKNEETRKLYSKLITEEYDEFIEAFESNDEVEELDACVDMVWVITGYMRARGWSVQTIKEAFNEVERSNYSKFVKEGNEFKCVKREDGKILKPETFSPADIESIINRSK